MNALISLWLPILLSAVVVFLISSLIHMVFKWHASEYRGFTNEDAVRDAIRASQPTPGGYVLPQCREMKDMGSEAMQKKYAEGPVAHITIVPNGPPKMGKHLALWFIWTLVVAAVAACLAGNIFGVRLAHAHGAAKLAGAVTLVAHGFGSVQESIWAGRPWGATAKHLLDAVLYAVGTGFVFVWLWP